MTGQSHSFSYVAQTLSGRPSVKKHRGLREEMQLRQDVLLKENPRLGSGAYDLIALINYLYDFSHFTSLCRGFLLLNNNNICLPAG